MTRSPRRIGALVAVGVLAITAVLAWLAWRVEADANENLLDRQVEQAASVLRGGVSLLQVQLVDAGQVAMATDAATEPFERFAAGRISPAGTFASLSLLRTGDGPAELLATAGEEPRLPDGGLESSFFTGLMPDAQLAVAGILPGDTDRLAVAVMPRDGAGLVVYAESVVSPEPQPTDPDDAAFGGLDFAVYLGRTTVADQLLLSTAPAPIGGQTQTATLPFGDTVLTVVGAAPEPLTSPLSTALPWIVLGAGSALAVAGAAGVTALSRRQAVAERLAADNERLYQQQRSIAGTLQHAMLPEVPRMDGLEIAARYVAGVDELDVGGDWFDLIPRGPGCCVFVVGDISGRGLPAATTMASLRFAVRAYLAQGDDIATVVAKLHRLLDVNTDHQFATVLIGELDSHAGRLRLVCAGHFPPLLVTGGRARTLDCPVAPPVGVETPAPPAATELALPPAGTLLAFTDGLIERRGEDIDTGLARLHDAVVSADGAPLDGIVDQVMRTLTADGATDDTVLLALRWTTSRADAPESWTTPAGKRCDVKTAGGATSSGSGDSEGAGTANLTGGQALT
ncbi:PP2C family protein-serine/threonine phosphatase [Trujillonella endophytica]|uniref:Serine phosphatase RsbU, regulator of sigma subunit n=1 Tax=Trujillonella endophytica TaxID=673521 RepID=A0A1H8PNB8_9ACTN|nr:PP2C family protein-serine/threonine phosphatase [Trujillella endophytica]SEO43271.1 Serine phosphatase RsbU, regulator of sigma subunit [Trujillella endophytica]